MFGVWTVSTFDLLERPLRLSFYVTLGDEHPLLGRDILCRGTLDGPGHSLSLPCEGDYPYFLPTYDDPHSVSSPRTYLSLLPTHSSAVTSYIKSCLQYCMSLFSNRQRIPKALSVARMNKRLAHRLHSYYHLPAHDLERICRRAGILTPMLSHSLRDVTRRCLACQGTGRPHRARKSSLTRVISSFNDHIKIDLMYLPDLTSLPILHTVDSATAFPECIILPSREMPDIISAIDRRWFSDHGPPASIGCDVEFSRSSQFRDFLRYSLLISRAALHVAIISLAVSSRNTVLSVT